MTSRISSDKRKVYILFEDDYEYSNIEGVFWDEEIPKQRVNDWNKKHKDQFGDTISMTPKCGCFVYCLRMHYEEHEVQ